MKKHLELGFFKYAVYGQVLAILDCGTSIFSKYLTVDNASAPTFLSFWGYVLLACLCLSYRYIKQTKPLGVRWWFYLILGVIDVEANYCVNTAFNYANFATVGLLLNLTTPFAAVLSFFLLKTRYKWKHIVGAVLAFGGCIAIFVGDYSSSNNATSSNEAKGNILTVVAAFLYAVSNVLEQWVVKLRDSIDANIECTGMVGFYGAILSGIQILGLERTKIHDIHWYSSIYLYYFGYGCAMVVFYLCTSVFIRWTESLMFNISILTMNIYDVIVNYYLFDTGVATSYWIALGFFYAGIILFSLEGPVLSTDRVFIHKYAYKEEIKAPDVYQTFPETRV